VYLLGTTLATLLAALFQLVAGRTFKEALLYWFASVIGFFFGHLVGMLLLPSWPALGPIYYVTGVFTALLSMFLVKHLNAC
jgi:hypothetical protein